MRDTVLVRWSEVSATMRSRSTQTNEVGRCATLLPVLGGLEGPLALLEVGASAGLCLHPDRWSYRYLDDAGAISEEGQDELVGFIGEAVAFAEEHEAEDMISFCTSAIREAANGPAVLARADVLLDDQDLLGGTG